MVVFYLFLHFLAPMEHLVLVTGVECILTRDLQGSRRTGWIPTTRPVQEVKGPRYQASRSPISPEYLQSRKHFHLVVLSLRCRHLME